MANEQVPSHFHISRPRHISWLTILLALLTVGTFIAISQPDMNYYVQRSMSGGGIYPTTVPGAVPQGGPMMNEVGVATAPAVPQNMMGVVKDSYPYPGPYPYPGGDVPATDTRELLKINYNATMQTRDVPGLVRRVETTVRGYAGRIDQESSSEKSGYVRFVVPASKYETFRSELEGLVGSRFLAVDIQSQNLLPQKQSIEEQQTQADKTLADYKTARQKLVSAHQSAVRELQAVIDEYDAQLAALREQPQTSPVLAQMGTLSDNIMLLKAQLANENTSYAAQLKNADANIKNAQDWQTAVKTQDTALMDNVATVSGSVSIQWISLWEMAQVYLPGYSIPAIFAVLTFLSFLWDRRRFGTV